MERLFLTIEQCKHLQELGLNMENAEFAWGRMMRTWDDKEPNAYRTKWRIYKNEPFIVQNFESWDMIPTYTLQEIEEKLPNCMILVLEQTVYGNIIWMNRAAHPLKKQPILLHEG